MSVSSANDNSGGHNRIRNGLLNKWASADFAEIASDDALERLAEARNSASKTANTFMLFAALSAFLYLLRVEGLAEDVRIGQFTLASLPFGLFVLSAFSLILSSVSFIRAGDSRGFDRLLRLACDQRFKCDCELRYLAFPNPNAWGEPFSQISYAVEARKSMRFVRFVGLTTANLFLLVILISPLAAGLDFLFFSRSAQDAEFANLRHYFVLFVAVCNAAIFILLAWVRFVDRD